MIIEEKLYEIQRKIEKLDLKNRKIIIWGRGQVSSIYYKAFLQEEINIYAFTDKEALENDKYYGYNVILPNEVCKLGKVLIIICVKKKTYVDEIRDYIGKLACSDVEVMTVDEYLLGKNAEKIVENISLLKDSKSKEIYTTLILRKLCGNLKMVDIFEKGSYFILPEFGVDDVEEVFVDLGGYVGDTLENYLFTKGASCII